MRVSVATVVVASYFILNVCLLVSVSDVVAAIFFSVARGFGIRSNIPSVICAQHVGPRVLSSTKCIHDDCHVARGLGR